MNDIEDIFNAETIQRYPDLSTDNLRHSYTDERIGKTGKPIQFDKVTELVASASSEIEEWYLSQPDAFADSNGRWNTYALGDYFQEIKKRFWNHDNFKQTLDLLGQDYKNREFVSIPWWNEIAAGEQGYEYKEGILRVDFVPRHSYETQMMRQGIKLDVKNVTVAGLIITKEGDKEYIPLGIRGGGAYPNTYHVNAGALMATQEFKEGKSTIHDVFQEKELRKEYGLSAEQLGPNSVSVLSRTFDDVLDHGPNYVFLVKTKYSREGLREFWENNKDKDKAEHDDIIFIENSPEAINNFIRENYVGHVENRQHRDDSKRFLLHPGALALASMSADGLKENYKEGNW